MCNCHGRMEELCPYSAECELIVQSFVLDLQLSHLLLQLDALLLPLDTQPLVILQEQRLIVSPAGGSTGSLIIMKDAVTSHTAKMLIILNKIVYFALCLQPPAESNTMVGTLHTPPQKKADLQYSVF